MPADEADLAYFLAYLPAKIPVQVLGLGSNMIVRDGGVPGVTIRLSGRAFGEVAFEDGYVVRAGAGVPDRVVARRAQAAGIDGLAFFVGVPGAIGGALRMNAGAHGGETKDVLVSARGVSRDGFVRDYSLADMGYSYRHADVAEDVIFTSALFRGRPGEPAAIAERDGPRHGGARKGAAHSRKDRRIDLQESAGRKGVAVDRPRRLPRPRRRRRAGQRDALQFSHQPGPRHAARTSNGSARRCAAASARRAAWSLSGKSGGWVDR